jgi:hypothetical protein
MGVSIRPAMNVKANSARTPHALEQADEVELHARERARDGGKHGKREQPVGVAKHSVAVDQRAFGPRLRQRRRRAGDHYRFEFAIHGLSSYKNTRPGRTFAAH